MIIEISNINADKLTNELIGAGVQPSSLLVTHKNDVTSIRFNDADMALVQQIIDAHDPTPIPAPPTDAERIEQLEQIINMLLMGDM